MQREGQSGQANLCGKGKMSENRKKGSDSKALADLRVQRKRQARALDGSTTLQQVGDTAFGEFGRGVMGDRLRLME